jgi:hypothetical protein
MALTNNFAVKIRRFTGVDYSKGESELIFEFPDRPAGRMGFHQKTAWRYRLRPDSDYVLEVTRYDKFPLAKPRSSAGRVKPSATEWGALVFHESWGSIFAENATLELGERAAWKTSVETFFPKHRDSQRNGNDAGFLDFLDMVKALVDLLNQVGV